MSLEATVSDVEWGMRILRCLAVVEKAQKYRLEATLRAGLRSVAEYVERNPHVMAWPEFVESLQPYLHLDPLWSVCIENNLPAGMLEPASPYLSKRCHRLLVLENAAMMDYLRFDVANRN